MHDVTALGCALDGRALEVRQVLTGEREDGRCLAARERNVVRGGGLVAVGGPPEVEVGRRAEVGGRLDRLMGRAVLTKTDGIVRTCE